MNQPNQNEAQEDPRNQSIDLTSVTRFELIDHTPSGKGRVISKYDITSAQLDYQDDGKTLKIFLK